MFLLNVFYVCLIPESLSKKAMRKSRSAQLSGATLITVDEDVHTQKDKPSLHWFDRLVKHLVPDQMPNRLGGKYSLFLLMVTAFLALMAIMGAVFQVSNYLLFKFNWSLSQIGYVGVIQGLSRLVSLTLLLPVVKRFSPSEPVASITFDLKIVVMGLLVEAFTMLLYGVTTVGEGFYVGRRFLLFVCSLYCFAQILFSPRLNRNTPPPPPLTTTQHPYFLSILPSMERRNPHHAGGATGSIGTLFIPALRGILSQSVTPDLIGQTLGTLAMFESFASVLAPLTGSWVYAGTLETWPSAVFYAAAFATTLSALLAAFVFFSHKRSLH